MTTNSNTYHRTNRLPCLVSLLHVLLVSHVLPSTQAGQATRPNIVILFADNLAYSDLSSLGGPPGRTPNLDRLAQQGITFHHWNSAAHLCSASRATLLTGKYAVRTGVYPRVFTNDAVFGLLPTEITLADYLKQEGYATQIVGKWHLGSRPNYLPTQQGFDEWLGIPYHMSGGSLDGHVCAYDSDETWWLPLYENETIVEQPVKIQNLGQRYAQRAAEFIQKNAASQTPFFLYMAFSHVHQLCAPKDGNEQEICQWAGSYSNNNDKDTTTATTTNNRESKNKPKTFGDAVKEMDWISGKVLDTLEEVGAANNTIVIFTSDNGPWLAEQSCAGSEGPYKGQWLAENVVHNCTACPHDFVPDPTQEHPRRCRLKEAGPNPKDPNAYVNGVHCGKDVGLGSLWEANLRMPAFARFPGKITPGTESKAVVSTLDVFPTILSLLNTSVVPGLDGKDISPVLFGNNQNYTSDERVLFFWRDGFSQGNLPAPYGRMDVAAVKIGHVKAWLWTKSAHYNDDVEQYHDPPLLFNVESDPAEAFPLDPKKHTDLIKRVLELVDAHKNSIEWTYPLALAQDPKYRPCSDPDNSCRTADNPTSNEETFSRKGSSFSRVQ